MELKSLSPAHLISIGSEEELLDVILSHSEYELSDERMTTTYNWEAVDAHILMKFLANKPQISYARDSLPSYSFKEDLNLHMQMTDLQKNQVRINYSSDISTNYPH